MSVLAQFWNTFVTVLGRMGPPLGNTLLRAGMILLGVAAGALMIVGGVFLAALVGTVSVVIVGVPALIVAMLGVIDGLRNFWSTLTTARHQAAETVMRAPDLPQRPWNRAPQPARLMYFYVEAWRVIADTSRSVWQPTKANVEDWFNTAQNLHQRAAAVPQHWARVPQKGFYWVLAFGVRVGGTFYYIAQVFILIVGSILHVLVNVTGITFSLIMIPALWARNRINSAYYRIYFRCPHANCHAQMDIPIYECPQCKTQHTRLRPSIYGVFYHRCKGPEGDTCNYPLPTLDALGRKNLTRYCPTCSREIPQIIGQATNVHLPIVGGPSAGKSYILAAMTSELMQADPLTKYGVRLTMPTDADTLRVEQQIDTLRDGGRLVKTSDADDNVSAVTMRASSTLNTMDRLLYVYDAAGEHYGTEDRAMQQIYFRYVGGVFLVVDPFSLDVVRTTYADEIEAQRTSIAPSLNPPEDIYGRMLDVLRTYGRKKIETVPVAVIMTKTDALDLDDKIGHTAAQRLMARFPTIRDESDALHILVQQFLQDNGATSFVLNSAQSV